MSNTIRVVGLDPSLRNWGISVGTYCKETKALTIQKLDVISPSVPTGKQVRQNSKDLESAKQLCAAVVEAVRGAKATFVEVPHGSQSARAMASYGICVGVLGALRAGGIPFIEVTAKEVKMVSVGKESASKMDMINWAMAKHPEAPWPTYKENGAQVLNKGKAEHCADATAAIHAGLACDTFKQMLALI